MPRAATGKSLWKFYTIFWSSLQVLIGSHCRDDRQKTKHVSCVIQGDAQAILNNRITAFEFADQAALDSAEEALTDCTKQARELGYTLFIEEDITGHRRDRAYIAK